MIKAAMLTWVFLCGVLTGAGETTREPHTFLRERIGLSDDQIAMIDGGKAVTKVFPSETPAEILVFGAVFVNATPEEYVKLAFDLSRLRRLPSYLGIGQFSGSPKLSDLEGFQLEPDDVKNLRNCRPGKCKVQLSAEAMRTLQEDVNWSAAGAGSQVNERVRKMALEALLRYQEAGNHALGTYSDKDRPFHVAGQLEELVSRSEALPVHLPELTRYLLAYPDPILTNVESLFYWERVSFGLKPTLRLNHAMAYRSTGPGGGAYVVAIKQLYASHYFQTALDLTACISGGSEGRGFYLITLKSSKQDGLTGFTGSIFRRIIVARARSAQERALIGVKKALEEQELMPERARAQATVE